MAKIQRVGLLIMPLLDHFHPPLSETRHWESFHSRWASLYTVAYRPVRPDDSGTLETWTRSLDIGQSLPVMPLGLDKGIVLPLDLESTYTTARQHRRMV